MNEKTVERRQFLSACTAVGAALAAGGVAAEAQQAAAVQQPAASPQPQSPPPRRRYRIDIEIVECKAGRCAQHQLGDTFAYPADRGRMCAWLLDSMSGAVRVLEYGGTMPWLYEGTPYKKVIDPDGITTEFIRCPDPTASGVVAKITRTKV
jgi:uncharacterized repeat protein (TIGR04076 family)